jgi:hypothetical protein
MLRRRSWELSQRFPGARLAMPARLSAALPRAISSAAAAEYSCPGQLIDVFSGSVTTATVLRNSMSAGREKIWSDVGGQAYLRCWYLCAVSGTAEALCRQDPGNRSGP